MSIWRLFRRRLWKLAFNLEKNGIMFILVRFMKKSRKVVFIFAVGLLVFLLVFTIYRFNSPWSGFSEKTLWDWLQLLIIPLVLAVIAISFNRVERKNEQAIAIGNQRETALQTYLDKMSELLLKEGLRNAVTDAEVCSIARARTLTVLRSLDGVRKGSLLMFLYEANLVHKDKCIIDLEGAYLHEAKLPSAANLRGVKLNGTFMMEARLHRVDLRDADLVDIRLTEATLSFANLSGANLSKAWMPHSYLHKANLHGINLSKASLFSTELEKANLSEADLREADLHNANLREANLRQANLNGADLSGADLSGADLSGADLSGAKLVNAILTKEQIEQAKPSTDT